MRTKAATALVDGRTENPTALVLGPAKDER
jgi:hypothetical protein